MNDNDLALVVTRLLPSLLAGHLACEHGLMALSIR